MSAGTFKHYRIEGFGSAFLLITGGSYRMRIQSTSSTSTSSERPEFIAYLMVGEEDLTTMQHACVSVKEVIESLVLRNQQ